MALDTAAGAHFLKAGNVGVDLAQHRRDAIRVVAPVHADAGVNVIGDHANRGELGDGSERPGCGKMV